jgi:hypothetical protein
MLHAGSVKALGKPPGTRRQNSGKYRCAILRGMKRVEQVRLYLTRRQEQLLLYILDVTRVSTMPRSKNGAKPATRRPNQRQAAVRRADRAAPVKPRSRWKQLGSRTGIGAAPRCTANARRRARRRCGETLEKPGRNVAAKAGLNRRLSDSGFGLLARLIAEKAAEAARRLVWVDPRFSSQGCSRCGHRAKESRRRRRFVCVACGFTTHADVNTALVIRRRAEFPLMSVLSVGQGR